MAPGHAELEAALPPVMLRAKLPRFLQKCAQEFLDDVLQRSPLPLRPDPVGQTPFFYNQPSHPASSLLMP